MADELRSHFEGTVRLLVGRGMSEEEARREARARFGDLERHRWVLERGQTRRERRKTMKGSLDVVVSGLRFALRSLRRSPGSAAAVIVTLALGVGANATMFRVVDRLLLRPPEHVERPDEVRRLFLRRDLEGAGTFVIPTFTYADVQGLRERGVFPQLAVYATPLPWVLGTGPQARQVEVSLAESDLFDLLGTPPALGRFFGPADDRPGAVPTAVVSHAFWTSHFGRDPGALGRRLPLGRGEYEVVGVAPPGFTGPELEPVDVWVPLRRAAEDMWSQDWRTDPMRWFFRAVARVAPDADHAMVDRRASQAFSAVRPGLPGSPSIVTSSLVRGAEPGPDADPVVTISLWLTGVSGLVLLVAVANVANLMLARSVRRRRDDAVRRALGIGRLRLVTQLAAEGVVLALLAGLLAAVVAVAGSGLLYRVLLPGVDLGTAADVARVGLFSVGVALAAAAVASVAPSLQTLRRSVGHVAAAASARQTGRSTFQRVLIVAQTTLSTVLLVGAGLFVTSFRSARTADLGMDVSRLVSVRLEKVPGEETDDLEARAEELLPRLPGVTTAARTVAIPFLQSWAMRIRSPEVDTLAGRGRRISANAVGADFFRVLDMSILRGRGFEPGDLATHAEPVAVVSRRTAESLWQQADPVGRCVYVGFGEDSPCSRVIGVVEEHSMFELDARPAGTVWVPVTHPEVRGTVGGVLVRTAGDPARAVSAIRNELMSLPGVRFPDVVPVRRLMEPVLRPHRLGAHVFSAFGGLALLVAALGLYSVLAFDVAHRTREIGIRMAVGASRSRVRGQILGRAFRDTGLGLGLGLVAAAVGSRVFAGLLFHTSTTDPFVFGGAAAILGLTALLAAWLPSVRATRIDPLECLATE